MAEGKKQKHGKKQPRHIRQQTLNLQAGDRTKNQGCKTHQKSYTQKSY